MEDHARTTSAAAGASRFELAPPRRFVLPAILLLLTEQPGYGYSLEKDLRDFRFGHIDRPTVYRTLAQLEADGLVESWSEAPTAGQARRVYGVTPLGERVAARVDERDQRGARLPRPRPSPLPGHRHGRCRPRRGRRGLGRGTRIRLVARRDDRRPRQRRLAPVDADRRSATPARAARVPARAGRAADEHRRAPLPPRSRIGRW